MVSTALELADALGRKEMAEALDVGASAVSNHVVMGVFPPSWYLVCNSLAAVKGVNCPLGLFAFKSLASPVTLNVNARGKNQGRRP